MSVLPRLCRSLWFAFRRRLGLVFLAIDSFTVSDFLPHLPPDLRCPFRLLLALPFSPAVGYALVLLAVGHALSGLLISRCCWVCSSRGPRTRVASSAHVFLLLTTDSQAVVPSLCGSLRLRGSLLSPPTPPLSIKPLRDCPFAVGALVPRIGSLRQRVLLTMTIGFSFARYFVFFTCSAEMSVPLFTGCVHPHTGFHRGLRNGVRLSMTDAICCDRSSCSAEFLALLRCCAVVLWRCGAAVSLARLCGSPHISEFCHDFVRVLQFSWTLTWLRASCSAGTPRLRHVRIDRPVFMSEPSNPSSLSSEARLLGICNSGPGDCPAASLEPGINMFWISAVMSVGIFWIICTCLCTCAFSRCSDRAVQGMELVVLCGGVLALYLWALHLCWHFNVHVLRL